MTTGGRHRATFARALAAGVATTLLLGVLFLHLGDLEGLGPLGLAILFPALVLGPGLAWFAFWRLLGGGRL